MVLHKKWVRLVVCIMILLTALAGCTSHTASINENLLFIDTAEEDKLLITVTCQARIDHFVSGVEERFPHIRIVQDIYQGNYVDYEHTARIKHGDVGDILMIKAGLIPKQDLSSLLIDLSTQTIPSNYKANVLQADQEGHIYIISGPLSFNCNVYNKTLFEENGWSVPDSYVEFVNLCKTIDKTGIRGCRYVNHDSSMQMFNFCARSAVDTLTTVEGQAWHSKLLAGEMVSLEPMETAFVDLQNLIHAGIVRPEDLEFTSEMRTASMLNREMAIGAAEISVLHKLCESGSDEFRFMPHFSMTDNEGWLLNQGYYFGANKSLREKGNDKKQEAVMEILSFLATEDGQNLLIEDGLGMIPSTKNAVIPNDPLLETIRSQVESGHYLIRPVYNMFSSVLSTEIAAFIRGETTYESVLLKCQAAMGEDRSSHEAMGKATDDFTVWQTGLLKADALRIQAETDISLIGVAEVDGYAPVGGTRCRIYQGPITDGDIMRITQITVKPVLKCATGTITGQELIRLLEHGATSAAEQESGNVSHFHPFAVSGLTLTYDLEAEEGSRVLHVKLADGKDVDPSMTYTLAYQEGALEQDAVSDSKALESPMSEIFREYVKREESVSPDSKRIKFQ